MAELDSNRWRILASYLDEALEMAPGARPRWLRSLALRDAGLAAEVGALLQEHGDVLSRNLLSGKVPSGLVATLSEGAAGAASDPPLEVARFAPGDRLAGRYQVVRFIARGGMGEVYECSDLELGQAVALKTLLPRYAADPTALARFKREIRLARQITHPNVCRLFDVGFHPGQPAVAFITMELLAGETLSELIEREGPLPPARARPLIEQLVRGLEAAHAVGVIHRDFKSSNVMVVAERAVITDFGLARWADGVDKDARVSRSGAILGTPAYMAPEQMQGGAITPASDVYALAVVIFEMVTRSLPFKADNALETAFMRLDTPAPAARTRTPDLDPAWDAAIARGLARGPADRFASASELLGALDGKRRRRRPLGWAAAALAAVVLSLGLATALRRGSHAPGVTHPARRSVAVVTVRNATGRADVAWLEAALGEMLAAELAAGERLRTIPGEVVNRMRRELELPATDSFSADTLARIRANLGVDVVVAGSYVSLGTGPGDQLRLDLRLQEAATGASLGVTSASGAQDQLFDIVSSAGADLRRHLGVDGGEANAEAGRGALPSSAEAARSYARGLDLARQLDYAGARAALEQVVRAEPGFSPGHAALADVDLASNDERAGRVEARRALETATGPREGKLLAEARYAWSVRDYARAARIYLTLFTFFPDELHYGHMLARSQLRADQRQEALSTVEALQRRPGLAQTDPMIDLIEARVAAKLGDRKRWQAAAARASRKARQQGALFVLADAQMEEGEAWQNLGEPGRAADAYQAARDIYQRFGNRAGLAGALVQVAKLGAEAGKLALATDLYGQALATYRALDDGYHIARTVDLLGDVAFMGGDLAGARRRWLEALPLWQQAGNREGVGWGNSKLGLVQAEEGDLPGAQRRFDEALAIHRQLGMRAGEADALTNRAVLLRLRGDLEAAEQALVEPLRLWRELGDQTELGHALAAQGDVARDRGDAARARRLYQEALALGERGDHPLEVAQQRLALARLALDEGRAGEAAAAARDAADVLARVHAEDDEAQAHELAARALVAAGDLAGAQPQLERAEARARQSLRLALRIRCAVTAARLAAARGQSARATAELRGLLGQAGLEGLPLLDLEVRLALAQQRHDRDELARLATRAAGRGFGLLARQARPPAY
jgi:tetratricopeptide (TPR) repeat protein/TolB-like protein